MVDLELPPNHLVNYANANMDDAYDFGRHILVHVFGYLKKLGAMAFVSTKYL